MVVVVVVGDQAEQKAVSGVPEVEVVVAVVVVVCSYSEVACMSSWPLKGGFTLPHALKDLGRVAANLNVHIHLLPTKHTQYRCVSVLYAVRAPSNHILHTVMPNGLQSQGVGSFMLASS